MTSKAFYKSRVPPILIKRISFDSNRRSLEVWTTTCIVTNFGKLTKANCSILINPSNPELSGVKNFPYFPRGGPVPQESPSSMHKDWQPLGFVSSWGGMEVGHGMMYPVSVVDGLVHQMGGWKLEAECKWLRMASLNGQPCPIGTAVKTSPGGLKEQYTQIIHTTPPFYKYCSEPEEGLKLCYQSALGLASYQDGNQRIAMPLLGSGARGFPHDVAVDIAASVSCSWCKEGCDHLKQEQVVAFGLLEEEHAQNLASVLEKL